MVANFTEMPPDRLFTESKNLHAEWRVWAGFWSGREFFAQTLYLHSAGEVQGLNQLDGLLLETRHWRINKRNWAQVSRDRGARALGQQGSVTACRFTMRLRLQRTLHKNSEK